MKKLLFFLVGLLFSHAACSAELFGSVDAIAGKVQMSDRSGKTYTATLGQQIYEGYSISVMDDSELHIATADGGLIALRPNTSFHIDEYKAYGGSSDKMFMSLEKGAMRSITGWIGKRNKSSYHVTTPTATIDIRGTDHETMVVEKSNQTVTDEPGTYETVTDGSTILKTAQGEIDVRPGKFAFAPKEKTVAPYEVSKPPMFFSSRELKIESRIQQRKDYLREHMEQIRDERIKQLTKDGIVTLDKDDNLLDPTRPTTGRESEDRTLPELSMVYMSPKRMSAVIDGQEVKLGEQFGEFKLTKIKDNEIVLTSPSGTAQVIKMHPGIDKKMIDLRKSAKKQSAKEQVE